MSWIHQRPKRDPRSIEARTQAITALREGRALKCDLFLEDYDLKPTELAIVEPVNWMDRPSIDAYVIAIIDLSECLPPENRGVCL